MVCPTRANIAFIVGSFFWLLAGYRDIQHGQLSEAEYSEGFHDYHDKTHRSTSLFLSLGVGLYLICGIVQSYYGYTECVVLAQEQKNNTVRIISNITEQPAAIIPYEHVLGLHGGLLAIGSVLKLVALLWGIPMIELGLVGVYLFLVYGLLTWYLGRHTKLDDTTLRMYRIGDILFLIGSLLYVVAEHITIKAYIMSTTPPYYVGGWLLFAGSLCWLLDGLAYSIADHYFNKQKTVGGTTGQQNLI